jgi:hypothetical protein
MASAKQILSYERELKESGIGDKQAEIHSRSLAEIIESTLVTKDHFDFRLKESENAVRNDIKDLKIVMYQLFIGSTSVLLAASGILQIVFRFLK